MIGAAQTFWWRVELAHDGVVLSTSKVCAREFGSRLIHFVMAPTPEKAEEKVKTKWAEWRDKRLARLRAADMCTSCGKEPPQPGHAKCERCLKLGRDNKSELAQLKKDPDAPALLAMRAEAIAAERRASIPAAAAGARRIRQKSADQRWEAGELFPSEISSLRRILVVLDRDPKAFREWLIAMIEDG